MLKLLNSIEEGMMKALLGGTMKILIEEVMVILRKRKVTKGISGIGNVEVLFTIRQNVARS